ncbi:hypothetical protein PHYBLDRAFT_62413 [Phycomyces blakesleeanus NRRL 1555(-)]|uniref:Nudix hydrolase domain-containing protein n=1 Tax=Phycomyces blakesleeanus (strain ATCC 8743b / DSM 1359 / FGSC 10004 / NBRC 33097 / NRRL 1555) TaxID=763407 RepID=A0A167PZN4_PHYB8|nr:hypothetical protein PHYBLDRAFT_62413 [Phycomyces blakesleeanus NRRL 1555(-)]OAD78827.1 hypothetical protein PHYBLDRAFT_62413 [Phycomyces blakesleeanus NRRL 1555(-)]|eukprot:XP_018296867.1 hypothetical protein PHYBLDRAFT_62413 [Phycomyces blakesleeanus NRRL 1555(-)]
MSASKSKFIHTQTSNLEDSVELYRSVAGIILKRHPMLSTKDNVIIETEIHEITRRPQECLYLLIKKPRKDHAWQFPQGGSEPGETVVEAALRELKEECGSDLKVKVNTKDIIGAYKYRFPVEFILSQKRSKKYVGAKVNFISAEWVSGQCQPDQQEIIDFGWLTREEITKYVSKEYRDAILPMLN